MKRSIFLLLLLLSAFFIFFLSQNAEDPLEVVVKVQPNAAARKSAATVKKQSVNRVIGGVSEQEQLIVEKPAPVPVPAQAQKPDAFIKKVITEKWIDAEGKAGRRRVRIVKADFKYANIRLEEEVWTDPDTGKQTVNRINASVADHVMVGLKKNVDADAARKALEQNGYKIRAVEPDSYMLAELPEFEAADAQKKSITEIEALNEFINYAEPDYLVYPSVVPNDPAYTDNKMWGLNNLGMVAGTVADADIDAPEAWDLEVDTSNVVVAVIDTGVHYTHEDLAPNMWSDADGYHGYDAYDIDDDPMDVDGHGTHCAGTIGARGNNGLGMTGVAWDVKLMALRFIGTYGGATSDAIVLINYARQNGADIINASWGGSGYSYGLENAIKACHTADIPFVAAAGNSNMNNNAVPHYPSSFQAPNIVSVAASDGNDTLAPFSNYGFRSVDIAAPGDNIWSCGIGSDSDYRYLSGTSMAAPHVTGALAMAKAYFPGETNEDLITRLYVSVDRLSAMTNKLSTGGRLNLHKLLVASDPVPRHNNYGNAYLFRGYYGYWSGSNARMTREEDEGQLNSGLGKRSMWFYWTAPADGLARLRVEAELGDVILEAFQRNPHQPIGDNHKDRSTKKSEFYLHVLKGKKYYFSLDSGLDEPQQMSIALMLNPVNDQFDNAIEISAGTRITEVGENTAATAEPFESVTGHAGHRARRSVWWKWTPSFSGPFVIATQGSEFDTVLAVYSGNKDSLQDEASNDDVSRLDWTSQVTLNVISGTTYHIAVDSFDTYSTGKIALNGYSPDQLSVLKQPAGTRVKIGSEVSFNVVAAGTDLRYQWEFNGEPIHGAVRSTYTLQGVVTQNYGSYRVRISNLSNQIYSNPVSLSEIATPPRVVWQSRSLNASAGDSVKLQVAVTGSEPMTYQWYKAEVPIPGANSKVLELSDVSTSDEAIYRFTATNALDSVPSAGMILSVYNSPWDGWHYLDPANQTGAVAAIIHEDGKWVAASAAYPGIRISVSQDGRNWRHQIIKPEAPVTSVSASTLVYGNGTWLVGGQSQSNFQTGGVLYKSTDLSNWEQIDIGIPLQSPQIIFHDGAFFLMNNHDSFSARLYRSVDGVTWQKQLKQDDVAIWAYPRMASSPQGLLLGGNSTTSAFFLPTSSLIWQEIDIDPNRLEYASKVVWFKDRFLAYASGNYESTDGVNWSAPLAQNDQTYPNYPMSYDWYAEIGDQIFTSSYDSLDGGQSWSTQSGNPSETTAAASDGTTVVFGTNKGGLFATNDPLNAKYAQEMIGSVISMDYQGGQFILHTSVLYNGSYTVGVAVSADSETWSVYPKRMIDDANTTIGGFDMKWINGEFWSPGFYESVYRNAKYYRGPVPSAAWRDDVPNLDQDYLSNFTEGPAGILAVRILAPQTYGDLVKSTDGGETWTAVSYPGERPRSYSKLQYIGGHYICDAPYGDYYVSADLIHWTSIGDLDHLIEHDGKFWAWLRGNVKTSTDMVNWSSWTLGSSKTMAEPVSFGGAMVSIFDNKLHYTYDGINWVTSTVGFAPKFVESTGDVLIVVGSAGQLARTGNISSFAPVVNILEPLVKAGASVSEGAWIPVRVDAFDPNQAGNPTVTLYYDGELVSELSKPPYDFEVAADEAGDHLIHVEARVGSGQVAYDLRHVKVTAPAVANGFVEAGGKKSLPGQTYYKNGIYFNGDDSEFLMSFNLKNWLPVSKMHLDWMVSGNNRLVAPTSILYGGAGSAVAVSSNGVSWQTVSLPTRSKTPIYFTAGYFWALSSEMILLSEDGLNWQARRFTNPLGNPNQNGLTAVGDPNGTMVAAPEYAGLWSSTDGGRNWSRILEELRFHGDPIYDGARFLVWGSIDGVKHYGTSTDGINWSMVPTGLNFANLKLVGGVLYAFDSSARMIGISQDGQNWETPETAMVWGDVTLGEDGYFYAVVNDPNMKAILRSADGFDWEEHSDLPGTTITSLLSSPDGLFISSSAGHLWKMNWGFNEWESLSEPTETSVVFKRLLGEGETVVALGNQLIYSSNDGGNSWSKVYDPAGTDLASVQFTDLFYRDGVWLAWAEDQALLRSVDGVIFSDITDEAAAMEFEALAAGADSWLAIKEDGSTWSSLDGLVWSEHAAAGAYPYANVRVIRHLNGKWFALSEDPEYPHGYDIRLASSDDGQSWQVTDIRMFSAYAIESANGILMVTEMRSGKITSDMSSWGGTMSHISLFAGNGAFYVIRDGWLERSTDGSTWIPTRELSEDYTSGSIIDGNMFLYGNNKITKIDSMDIKVEKIEMPAGEFAVGDVIEFSMELENVGTEVFPAGNYPVEVFLSTDRFHGDADDSRLGIARVTVPELAPGSSTSITVSAIIPNGVSPGDFRIRVIFNQDEAATERIFENNFCMSRESLVSIPAWTLTINANEGGQVSQDANNRTFANGRRISLIATAGKGSAFEAWGGDAVGSESQITILMNGDKTVQASFSSRASLQVEVQGAGQVFGLSESGRYELASEASLTAVPEDGWEFDGWSGAESGTQNPLKVTMNETKSLAAKFVWPRNNWKSHHFNSTEVNDLAISGDDADPDQDGLKNWQEYLHGSSPRDKKSNGRIRMKVEGGFLSLIYTRMAGPESGMSMSCRASRNLQSWNTPDVQERVLSVEDGVETVEARLPANDAPTGFFMFEYRK